LLGYYIPDFIVEENIVVEIKALNEMDNTHLAQIIGYLAVTQCPSGLLNLMSSEAEAENNPILPVDNIQSTTS
jgi:GxxExxY protein